MTREHDDWFGCPVCGAQVPAKALACPECGADDETGWSEDAAYDELDLPVDDEPPADLKSTSAWWRWAVVGVVVVFLLWVMTR